MPLLLISALSVLCFSNLSVVIPPSGFIDTMMERSNRTRGAFVSPNHLGLCWKQRDRGGGGEQGGGGRDKSEEDPHRERERQHRLLFDFLWLRRKKNTSYSGCPSHQPCSRQTRQRGDRRSTQRPSFSFLSLDLCQRHLWACRGPVDTERLLVTCLSAFHKIYCICSWLAHMDYMGNHMGKSWEWEMMIAHCCFREKGNNPRGTDDRFSWWTLVM